MRRVLFVAASVLILGVGSAAGAEVLRPVADIPLPGGTTRFDYQSFDPSTNRLYISHMGDGRVVIVDTRKRRVVASLPGFPGATGIRVVPALQSVFVSVTGNGEIAVLNTASLKVKRIPDGEFPDGIAYAVDAGKVYVSDERAGHETVIDARTMRRIGTIDIGGEAGNTQYDPASKHILVNVQSTNEMVEIDPATDTVTARHRLKGGKSPHGLELVTNRRIAFAACEDDSKLLVIDLEKWKTIETLKTGRGPDVLAFDDALGLLYVGTESEVVSVFDLEGNDLDRQGDVEVGPNAHSVAIDPGTHEVFVPLENVGGRPVLRVLLPVR